MIFENPNIIVQVKICGHATLAAAHKLFSSGLVDTHIIEFYTVSGVVTAKKITANLQNGAVCDGFDIEIDLPAHPIIECNLDETSQISGALNGASIIDIKRTKIGDDILVILASSLFHFDYFIIGMGYSFMICLRLSLHQEKT